MGAKSKPSTARQAPTARTPRVVIDVTVHQLFNEPGARKCACCPGGRHRFGAGATITACEPDIRLPYEHLRDLPGTLSEFFAEHGRDGKRVRITVEELSDA
jgi:hypothetical protein